MTRGFILALATGPYIQQGVREHCIILHWSACSRGVQAGRERERSSQVSARVIEASANIGESEQSFYRHKEGRLHVRGDL